MLPLGGIEGPECAAVEREVGPMTGSSVGDPLMTTFGRLLEASGRLEQQLGREMEAESGLPLTWFEVLLRLARSPEGQLSMGCLTAQLALTSGGVTRLVDRLIAAGYVERRLCPTDRRVSYAAVTPAGHAALDRAGPAHACALNRTFSSFSTAELVMLDGLLDRLRDA